MKISYYRVYRCLKSVGSSKTRENRIVERIASGNLQNSVIPEVSRHDCGRV